MTTAASSREMRAVYCETLMRLAREDSRIVAVQADLTAAHGMKPFAEAFPDRSFNVGAAEANMIGVAAGLAACGKVPFVHSFSTFASRRCLDQIAVSVCYSGLNVKITGSDPGVCAELNGGTHMGVEDAALMRALPGMRVTEPVDATQLALALPVVAAHAGPVYIRLMRKAVPAVFSPDYAFRFGRADVLRPGRDVTVAACGLCVNEALAAAAMLAGQGIDAEVIAVHSLKPFDADTLVDAARRTGAVVTAENHSIIGGLGSAAAETLSERLPTPLARVGIRDRFGEVGKAEYLMKTLHISAGDIVAAARDVVGRKVV